MDQVYVQQDRTVFHLIDKCKPFNTGDVTGDT